MLKNYLKIALRNLRRDRAHAFINIVGLTVGIACCILILVYVQNELRFDRFHGKADRIYRVLETRSSPDLGQRRFAQTAGPVGPALTAEFPEVAATTRLISLWRMTVDQGETWFYEGDYFFAEPSFFEVFDFKLQHGDSRTALSEPGTVILTQEAARKYFGEEDPYGKMLQIESLGETRVTGVLEELPSNSHLRFSMLLPFASIDRAVEEWSEFTADWNTSDRGFITYVVLRPDQNAPVVEARAPALLNRYLDREATGVEALSLQPLVDIHFHSGEIEADVNHHEGNVAYVYIFSAIALFILGIACINYVNMATARALRRTREVGVRKAVGAHRSDLVSQFLSESMLAVLIAFALGLALAQLLLPAFSTLAGRPLTFSPLENWPTLIGLIGMAVIIGLAAGSYPAFFLSRFKPVTVLKGLPEHVRGAHLRRGLVVVQFTLSIVLVIATVVVHRQLNYIQTKNLGYNEEQLIAIDINNGDVRRNFETVKAEFARIPSVRNVTVSSRLPGDWKGIDQIEVLPEGASTPTTMHLIGIGEDFTGTYDLAMAEGRNFSPSFASDSAAILINETAARMLGGSGIVGQHVSFQGSDFQAHVIGIVKDFHFRSLHEPIGPLVLAHRANPLQAIDYFTVRVEAANLPATINQLRSVGERFDPTHPFEYNFLDERLRDFYESELRVGRLVSAAAGIAILIACLGLFGLAAFMAEQRTKEIGIRKVLGASISGIVLLLSRDFVRLVLIALVLAAPLAYLAMQRWLAGFAYHAALSWWIFVVAGLLALGIAVLTVSYQSIKAALSDPVKSLRYE